MTTHIFRLTASCAASFACAAGGMFTASSASGSPVPFGNHTYDLILDDTITWPAANTAAAGSGGRLATITSAGEQAFIESLLINRSAPTGAYWFGLQEVGMSNVFVPLNNETTTYNNFAPGEPNSGVTVAESVGSIFWTADPAGPGFSRRGQWNDLPPGGYPDAAFITDEADLYRAGYLVEFDRSGVGNGDGNGTDGGGGGNAIPIPAAALAFPVTAALAFVARRRMLRV
jgi:hypothetical protein